MKLIIYPLRTTPLGKVPGEFDLASVVLDGGQTRIECPDPALQERLTEIFSTPLKARRAVGVGLGVVGWEIYQLEPNTDIFFEEVRLRLHQYDLVGVRA